MTYSISKMVITLEKVNVNPSSNLGLDILHFPLCYGLAKDLNQYPSYSYEYIVG